MAGRRLLDFARLASASRSIAQQHVALSRQQFDTYNKTSSLAKAVKSQTDRVTLTAQAAIALAKRFSEDVPKYNSPTERWTPGDDLFGTSSTTATTGSDGGARAADSKGGNQPEGIEQDHHYRRDENNSVDQPPAPGEIDVLQERAPKEPLPDGTIPPTKDQLRRPPPPDEVLGTEEQAEQQRRDSAQELSPDQARRLQRQAEKQIPSVFTTDEAGHDTIENKDLNPVSFTGRSEQETTAYSSLPRAKVPKNTESRQASDVHVDDARINQDVFYSRGSTQSARAEEEVPEGVNLDVFHSPRIAKMLGGKEKKGYGLDLGAQRRAPANGVPSQQDGVWFDASANPTVTQPAPPPQSKPSSGVSEQEMMNLADEIAKDVSALPAASEAVSTSIHPAALLADTLTA